MLCPNKTNLVAFWKIEDNIFADRKPWYSPVGSQMGPNLILKDATRKCRRKQQNWASKIEVLRWLKC